MKWRYPVENVEGLNVRVYRNLHVGGWSIQAREGDYKGLVVAHAKEMGLEDVVMKIQKKGQEKVRKEKVKNVHAFLEGKLVLKEEDSMEGVQDEIYYDPYSCDAFMNRRTGEDVWGVECVWCARNGKAYQVEKELEAVE